MNEQITDCTLCSLKGKAAVVTGGAMGIGFGITKRFAEAGANVLLADIDAKAADAAAGRLRGGKGRVVAVAVDIADDAAPEIIVSKCIESFGGLDVLVNNAGIFPSVPALKMAPELFDRVLRINLRGLVLLSKSAGLQMVKQGRGGKVINIGSIDSLRPSMIGLAAYDASKGAVLMFTRSFALEMASHNVQVNAILPGGITTEGASRPLQGSGMTEAQMKEVLAAFVKKIPLGRMGVPDDIAKVAVFLASPASDYITGADIVVDGGALLT
jgi:2-dehydro-3-deoxy-D-gluconate 5-dehydrogenase